MRRLEYKKSSNALNNGQTIGLEIIRVLDSFISKECLKANNDAWITAKLYVSNIGIWFVALIYLKTSKENQPILNAIGRKPRGNTGKMLLLGLILGFGLNGICALFAYLNHDISLKYIGFHPISFIMIFLCVFVQSSAEELMCRGFLYQKIMQYSRNPLLSFLVNSLLFAILHLLNPGVTVLSVVNIFLSGLMFSMMVYYMDSLWCAFAVHTAWNFTQNIILGLPNSGKLVPYSVFQLDESTARNSFAYEVWQDADAA